MGYFAKLFSRGDIAPNANGPLGYDPGDPNGIEFEASTEVEQRSLSTVLPTPWDGWPTGWGTNWQVDSGINTLVDVAWACLDLNSSIISSMPVYRLRDGILPPTQWMVNPDPDIYSSWQEFAKQLFWDFQMGEAFVLPFAHGSDGYPSRFRVIPPFLVSVEIRNGRRIYRFAKDDVTDEILHLRYKSTTIAARGMGPLEAAGARMTAIGLLQRYADELAKTGGVPLYWMELERRITEGEGKDLLDRWIESRIKNAGQPALVSNGAKLNQAKSMSAKDMALMELSQFHESRIAVLLGVPPFLVGLAGATGSLCVDTETEMLTRSGWKRYDEVVIGDEALTLNQETGVSEWQPVLDVSVFDVVDRNMISMNMVGHSSFSTDDHQWPVIYTYQRTGASRRMLRLTRDICATDALITAAPCADQPVDAKYTDAFVELAAWWYTEGNSVFTGQALTAWLAQSESVNPEHCARIRLALTTLFGPPAVTRNKSAAWSQYAYKQATGKVINQFRLNGMASEALLALFEDVDRKVLKREFLYDLTSAQLELFIQVSLWADGCESTFTSFKQADEDRLQIFELACWLAGKTTQRHGTTKSVTIRKRQGIKPVASNGIAVRAGREPIIKAFKWTGRVWCPTTPNQTWFARRNGTQYFTHNTYSNIADLFDFHDRSSLRPKVRTVMEGMSAWSLPNGQTVELNRDDYTRLPADKRVEVYAKYIEMGVLTPEDVKTMERFYGAATNTAAQALTGGTQ